MATWYSLEIGSDLSSNKIMQRVMDAFTPKYIGAGRPLDMAIFTSIRQSDKNITLYFSPKTASLAMQFGASLFEGEFVNMDLALLVGDERSVDVLFSNDD